MSHDSIHKKTAQNDMPLFAKNLGKQYKISYKDTRSFHGGSVGRIHLQPRRCRFDRRAGKDPLEKEMATHSRILAWEIPWTEESGGLQSGGCKRVGQDLATKQQHHLIQVRN